MRGLKLSLAYFGAIGLVIALQLFPLTGIFLMFFGAALWSAVIFNVWMAHLGIAAVRRRIARAWIAVPVAVYVVYGVLALNGYRDALAMRTHIAQEAHIDTAALPPGLKAIQFPESKDYSSNDAVAYAQIENGFDVYAGARNYHRAAASDPDCRSRDLETETRAHGFFPADMNKEASFGGGDRWEYCVLSQPATPPADTIRIERQQTPTAAAAIDWIDLGWARIGFLPGGFAPVAKLDTVTFAVAHGDGLPRTIGHAQTGSIDYPWPVPAFIAGCFLDDAYNSWDCMFGLAHETLTVGKVEGLGSFRESAARAAYLAGVLHLPVRDLTGK